MPVRRARSKLQCLGGVPAPPGIVMVAPAEVPRNAEGAKLRPRWVEAHKARPRTVYDAATGVNVQTSGTTASGAPSLVVGALAIGVGESTAETAAISTPGASLRIVILPLLPVN